MYNIIETLLLWGFKADVLLCFPHQSSLEASDHLKLPAFLDINIWFYAKIVLF